MKDKRTRIDQYSTPISGISDWHFGRYSHERQREFSFWAMGAIVIHWHLQSRTLEPITTVMILQ